MRFRSFWVGVLQLTNFVPDLAFLFDLLIILFDEGFYRVEEVLFVEERMRTLEHIGTVDQRRPLRTSPASGNDVRRLTSGQGRLCPLAPFNFLQWKMSLSTETLTAALI